MAPLAGKKGAENLPAKDCAGPSPHPGLEVSPCKQGHAPAVPSGPLILGAQHSQK